MTFIRKRYYPEDKHKDRWPLAPRYQLVQTYRERGKVLQRVASLGRHPTVAEALIAFGQEVARYESRANAKPTNWRASRRWLKRGRAENEISLIKARAKLERLKAVVSTTSRRRDIIDTTGNLKDNPKGPY